MMVNHLEKGIPIPDRVLTLGIHLNIAYATCLVECQIPPFM